MALLALLALALVALASSQCNNDCNRHGYCNQWSACECFEAYEGPDCAFKKCPMGPALADIPSGFDTAHEPIPCSGQGTCDRSSGICVCNSGYSGYNCGTQSGCVNDCSGRGKCLSLRQMAIENDGYSLNYTTSYTLWDADLFKTCVCDRGYQGSDCSQRICESGVDPRLSSQFHEVVTLVCDCTVGCDGKFKLQYMGITSKKWLSSRANVTALAHVLMASPGIYSDSSVFAKASVLVYNDQNNASLCSTGVKTTNKIQFYRNAGDQPKISFYANLMNPRSALYFETRQQVSCDCATHQSCNGTFRLNFDGQMSAVLNSAANGTDVLLALQRMSRVTAAGYSVEVTAYSTKDYFSSPVMTSLCTPYHTNNLTVVFTGNSGNAPRLSLWSSVVGNHNPSQYVSTNRSAIMTVLTDDGRDDYVKICNGLGTCDFSTGTCSCAHNWGPDPNVGPCGRFLYNTSRDAGPGRCPGLYPINYVSSQRPARFDAVPNHDPRIFLSVNPNLPAAYAGTTPVYSAIYEYPYAPAELLGPQITPESKTWVLDLTSSSSAGMLCLDNMETMLYFIDHNPSAKFIGKHNLSNPTAGNYTRYIELSTINVYTLTLDVHMNHRRLYYSVPHDSSNSYQGSIYFVLLSQQVSPTIYQLQDFIGTDLIGQPYGLAVNYANHRLYWMDANHSYPANASAVLRSVVAHTQFFSDASLYSGFQELPVFWDAARNQAVTFTNLSQVANLTDILIDGAANNTVFMLDASPERYGIYAVNLDAPISYDKKIVNSSDMYFQFEEYVSPRRVFSDHVQAMGQPRFLMRDSANKLIFYTDSGANDVGYARTVTWSSDFTPRGYAFKGNQSSLTLPSWEPVGIALNDGMMRVGFTAYVDCFGRGVCEPQNNFHCSCFKNYFGDCRLRSCPKSLYWVGELRQDNIAHDRMVECGGIGRCDYNRGICACPQGFEGVACERLTCPRAWARNDSKPCFDQGRCLSLRNAAAYFTDSSDRPSPMVYGSKVRDMRTWDADRIHVCLPDAYGYLRDEKNLVHSSPKVVNTTAELSESLTPINAHTVRARVGQSLDAFDCPRGLNRRKLDALVPRVNSSAFQLAPAIGNSSFYSPYAAQYLEVQHLACDATYGSFKLTFRGHTSATIRANETIPRLQAILEALPTLGRVHLNATGPSVCTTLHGGSNIYITFLSQLTKAVPLLQITDGGVYGRPGTLELTRISALAVDQLEECAGHGVCDRSTGHCRCWDGWGPSNGLGGVGTHGDCGRYLL